MGWGDSVSRAEKSRERCIRNLNWGYNSALKSLAKIPLENMVRKINEFPGGAFHRISHVIETHWGLRIHSYTDILEYNAYGISNAVHHEAMKCYCGTLIDHPVPSTIYLKEQLEFLGKKKVWLPYHQDTISSEVYKNKLNWNSLIETLNKSKDLQSNIKKLSATKTIFGINPKLQVGRHQKFEISINDKPDNHETICQIIPLGTQTLIATSHPVEKFNYIEYAVRTILGTAKIIREMKLTQPQTGTIILNWAENLLQLIEGRASLAPRKQESSTTVSSVSSESQTDPTLKPIPEPSPKTVCRRCGYNNPQENKFCGNCGALIQAKPLFCPNCGHPNDPENNYCGKCGSQISEQRLSLRNVRTFSTQESLKRIVSQINGGRRARWLVQFGSENEIVREIHVNNFYGDGWRSPKSFLDRVVQTIQKTDHYTTYKALRHIYAPNGETVAGEWIHFTVVFNEGSSKLIRGRRFQLLMVIVEGGGFRLVGSDDQGLTKEMYTDVLRNILDPKRVKELTMWTSLEI
jgi:hypothetical protein